MAKHRPNRFSGELQREISDIIKKEINDPRLTLVSVVRVEASPDLTHAKVYVSGMKDDAADGIIAALDSAKGFIRHKLSRILTTRTVPELSFVFDDSIAYGVRMTEFIDKQIRMDEENAAARADEENEGK